MSCDAWLLFECFAGVAPEAAAEAELVEAEAAAVTAIAAAVEVVVLVVMLEATAVAHAARNQDLALVPQYAFFLLLLLFSLFVCSLFLLSIFYIAIIFQVNTRSRSPIPDESKDKKDKKAARSRSPSAEEEEPRKEKKEKKEKKDKKQKKKKKASMSRSRSPPLPTSASGWAAGVSSCFSVLALSLSLSLFTVPFRLSLCILYGPPYSHSSITDTCFHLIFGYVNSLVVLCECYLGGDQESALREQLLRDRALKARQTWMVKGCHKTTLDQQLCASSWCILACWCIHWLCCACSVCVLKWDIDFAVRCGFWRMRDCRYLFIMRACLNGSSDFAFICVFVSRVFLSTCPSIHASNSYWCMASKIGDPSKKK